MMPKDLENHLKVHHSTKLRALKIRCGAKDFMCVATTVGEEGVALKVGETAASHPLHAPV